MRKFIKAQKTEIALSSKNSDKFILIVLDEYAGGIFHLIHSEDGIVKDELKTYSKNKAYEQFHELQESFFGTIQNKLHLN